MGGMGAGTAHVSPPVPAPLSTLSFPLDVTRYYLLGQLEYYLSPQNMAQDFYLRQQVGGIFLFFLSVPV
jgi:la-related protein 1